MSNMTLAASTRRSIEDILVGACGLVTCLLTAIILWGIKYATGMCIYLWMAWFVPVGAIASGVAGASGYYVGSRLFNHRPSPLLFVNMVISSVFMFLAIHYFSYRMLSFRGRALSDFVPFAQYLDVAIRSTRLGFIPLGILGYVVAVLQIVGFAFGGHIVYGYLQRDPYCDDCSRYLSPHTQFARYTLDPETLRANATRVVDLVKAGAVGSAIDAHQQFGSATDADGENLRSVIELRDCSACRRHWAEFSIQEQNGHGGWKKVSHHSVATFTREVIAA